MNNGFLPCPYCAHDEIILQPETNACCCTFCHACGPSNDPTRHKWNSLPRDIAQDNPDCLAEAFSLVRNLCARVKALEAAQKPRVFTANPTFRFLQDPK
jgi:hypothetical protein